MLCYKLNAMRHVPPPHHHHRHLKHSIFPLYLYIRFHTSILYIKIIGSLEKREYKAKFKPTTRIT